MSVIQKSVEVEQPVTTVYNQWTQFETFPQFMQGVEEVRQLDDTHLHWKAKVGPAEREWDAEIIEQEPDRVIAWRAMGEVQNDGRVQFTPLGSDKTKVEVVFEMDPEGWVEKTGDALGIVDMRIQRDLDRFKKFAEERTFATGAWRGEVHGGVETS
jgi:uncharacterized membrane protein